MRKLTIIFTLCAVLLAWSAMAAQTINIAVVTRPGMGQSMVAEKFAEKINKADRGYTANVIDSGKAGNETRILQKLQKGELQMAVITAGPYDQFVPAVEALEFPFLFSTYEQVDKALGGKAGKALLSRLEKAGFKGLAFSENGFRHLTNNKRPVHTVAEVNGLKIRTMNSKAHEALWTALGAIAEPHSFPINDLLASGRIDGQENPLWVIKAYELNKLQRFLSMTGHVYSAHIASASLKWWLSLPEQDRQMLEKAMVQAAAEQRADNRTAERGILEQLFKQGMAIDLTPDINSFEAKLGDYAARPMYQKPETAKMLELLRAGE